MSKRDVLIVDDHEDQVRKIATWLGIGEIQYTFCKRFADAEATGSDPNSEFDRGLVWLKTEIRSLDPRVVLLDYLLTKEYGALSYDGIAYGKELKAVWPQLRVVIVTTNESNLEQMRKDHKWPVDAVWHKPWNALSAAAVDPTKREALKNFLADSLRPSEHV